MSTNGPTGRGVRSLTTAGLVAVVAALVLGILGMHGLGQHGATGHGSQLAAAASADPHASHPAPDDGPLATDAASTAARGPAAGAMSDGHGSGADMAMLCVAMLLTAAVGVLLALRLMRLVRRAPPALLPATHVLTLPATARAGTGPPAVWEFSVVRC